MDVVKVVGDITIKFVETEEGRLGFYVEGNVNDKVLWVADYNLVTALEKFDRFLTGAFNRGKQE